VAEDIDLKLIGRPFVAGVDSQRLFSDCVTVVLPEGIVNRFDRGCGLLYGRFGKYGQT
jgi:hypothetical protein